MLTKYILAAMHHAQYKILEDGSYFGNIPVCKGVLSNASTLEACREHLQEVLEDWILLGIKLGDPLPTIDGIRLIATEAA